jgi:hypothetical protein
MGIATVSATPPTLQHCKILQQQQNSKGIEQSNQSHPPSSVQVTSQCGCEFTLAMSCMGAFVLTPLKVN